MVLFYQVKTTVVVGSIIVFGFKPSTFAALGTAGMYMFACSATWEVRFLLSMLQISPNA